MVVEGACRGFVCGLFVCLFGVSSFFGSECAGRGCVSFVSFFVRCVCFPRPSLQFPNIKAVHLSGAVRAQEGACMGVVMGAKVDSGKWKEGEKEFVLARRRRRQVNAVVVAVFVYPQQLNHLRRPLQQSHNLAILFLPTSTSSSSSFFLLSTD